MRDVRKYIAAFLGMAILVFLVWYFSAIVAYILIAVVLSFIGRPLVEFLDFKIGKFRIPRGLAAAFTLAIMWTVFVLFFYYITPLVANEFGSLRDIDYNKAAEKLSDPINRLNAMLSSFYNESVDVVEPLKEKLGSLLTSQNTMGIFNSLTGTVTSLLVALFSITFMAFFFLKDSGLFMKGVLIFTPEKYQQHIKDSFASIKKLLVRYFLGIFLEVIIIFVLVTIGLSLVGVVLLNNLDLPMYEELLPLLGFTALIFAIVQLLDNIVLQPFIYSSSVFAHPLEIFLLILIAGSLAGPIGMILAVPAYTILRVVGYEFFAQYEVVKRLTRGISNERGEEESATKGDATV